MEIHSAFTWNGQAFKNKEALLSFAQYEDEDAFLFLKALFGGEDHLLVPTSGSTGKPSEIQLPKSMMLASSKATGEFFHLKPGSTAFHALPYKYIAGKMMLFRAMHLGLQLYSQRPKIEIKDLGSQMFDFAAMVPLQAESMISEIQRFKELILGGGQVNVSLQHQLFELPSKIYETYGMTETVTHVAVKPISALAGASEAMNYFRALPGVSFSVDHRDCLVIHSKRIQSGLLTTNDLVKLKDETQFQWLGRVDNVVNSGGLKLMPEKIEAALVPFVDREFFVAGKADELLGQKLVLIVEGEIEETWFERLRDRLKLEASDQLSSVELPKEVFSLAEFLRTETGKIQRKESLKALGL